MALNLDGDGQGGDIVVVTGEARVVGDAPPAHEAPEYAAKYAEGFMRIGMTAEQFAATYSVPIRMTPSKLSGH